MPKEQEDFLGSYQGKRFLVALRNERKVLLDSLIQANPLTSPNLIIKIQSRIEMIDLILDPVQIAKYVDKHCPATESIV
jgi:hypothetical protein